MWDSYQEILSTRLEQVEHINQFLYNNMEHPYITRLLKNENGNTGQDVEDGDVNTCEDGYDSGCHDERVYAGEADDRGEGNASGST